MKKKLFTIAVSAMAVGCTSPEIQKNNSGIYDQVKPKMAAMSVAMPDDMGNVTGSSEYASAKSAEQAKMPVMRKSKSTYIGSRMVPVTSDDKLPSIFKQEFIWAVDDARVSRSVTLTTVANRITNTTKIPVRIQPDAMGLPIVAPSIPAKQNQQSNAAVDNSSVAAPLTIDTAELRYSGPLAGFLNHITDRTGLSWEYRDGTIVIMRFVTEAHEISAFIGKSKYDMNSGSSGGGSTSGSQSSDSKLSVEDAGSTDAFGSLQATVEKIISIAPGSSVIRADGSKTLHVRTTKELQSQVRDFIASENTAMQKQALIQFDIYSVQINENDERGVNWNILFNSLSQVYGISTASPATLAGVNAGQLGINILKGDGDASKRFANTVAFFNMLKQNGTSVQHRVIPVMGLNGQWARKSRLNTESFISETTPGASSAVGAGAPGIKTDKVTTGDQFQILPQIQSNNTILLKFGVSLSDLLGLTDQTSGIGANQQKIQTTKVSSNNEQQSILIKPGEVVSVSGLSRLVSNGDQRTLAENVPILFGGSRKAGVIREHFIIFIRAVVI
jgi:type IVB pilus formation R64 PilN family outer membrane protein